MNKKDKKFISVLILLHTGLLTLAISLSGYYWHHSMLKAFEIKNLYELSAWVNGENSQMESNEKVQKLKKQYEAKGIKAREE